MFTHQISDLSKQHNLPYNMLQSIIPGKIITIETIDERAVQYYDKLIVVIIKVIDINNITYCTDKQYRLITIYRAEDMLIYIISSYYKCIFFIFYFLLFISIIMLLFSLSCLCYILLSNLICSFFFYNPNQILSIYYLFIIFLQPFLRFDQIYYSYYFQLLLIIPFLLLHSITFFILLSSDSVRP